MYIVKRNVMEAVYTHMHMEVCTCSHRETCKCLHMRSNFCCLDSKIDWTKNSGGGQKCW
jgi:hypothetical protein